MVPAWNEEERLAECIERLLSYAPKWNCEYEIVICTDGSTDRTLSIANEYAIKNLDVKVSYWPERLGKGGAILHGLKKASGNIMVFTDVDLSAPPEQIPMLVDPIRTGASDLAIGSRNLRESVITEKPPTHRIFLGKAFNFLCRQMFHTDQRDAQCGFKAIRADALRILSNEISIKGYAFDIDLIVNAIRRGYKVIELPIVWGHKKGSKVNSIHQTFVMGRSLLVVWFRNQKREPKSLNN